jgi:hypothetical protein
VKGREAKEVEINVINFVEQISNYKSRVQSIKKKNKKH